jgi:hypothetical protein
MMTGIPVVSIGPKHMNVFPYGPDLFEGHEIAVNGMNDPDEARAVLTAWMDGQTAKTWSLGRARAIALFGRDKIAGEWKAYLG